MLISKAFGLALSPSAKKTCVGKDLDQEEGVPAVAAGKLDNANGNENKEETEEEVQELLEQVEAAVRSVPSHSLEAQLLGALLLKVRGFVAKVFISLVIFSDRFIRWM